jgi:hypothetical protein
MLPRVPYLRPFDGAVELEWRLVVVLKSDG